MQTRIIERRHCDQQFSGLRIVAITCIGLVRNTQENSALADFCAGGGLTCALMWLLDYLSCPNLLVLYELTSSISKE
jgi:hypothetical protein